MTSLPLYIIALHFLGDFVLQNDWMAHGKSSRFLPLTVHVAVYSAVFAVVIGWQFAAVTFALHWVTDALTSRVNKVLLEVGSNREKPSHHWFFVGVGLDQWTHYVALAWTLEWLV